MNGYVYLMRIPSGEVKIGRSKNPAVRVLDFSVLPFAVELVHKIETNHMGWCEKELHRRYAAHRVRGEWFRLPDTDLETLMSLPRLDRPVLANKGKVAATSLLTSEEFALLERLQAEALRRHGRPAAGSDILRLGLNALAREWGVSPAPVPLRSNSRKKSRGQVTP